MFKESPKRYVLLPILLILIACSSPHDQFNTAIDEAIKAAKTDDVRQRLQRLKNVSGTLKDQELMQFVKGWEEYKKAQANLDAHISKGPPKN